MKVVKETKLNEQMKEHWETDVNAIKEALEKQIPKKPCYIKEHNDIYFDWQCTNCKRKYVNSTYGISYCVDCGQAIDWSEEDHKVALKETAELIELYEKALDKACEILEPKMKCLTGRTKEEWKEWLLKIDNEKSLKLEAERMRSSVCTGVVTMPKEINDMKPSEINKIFGRSCEICGEGTNSPNNFLCEKCNKVLGNIVNVFTNVDITDSIVKKLYNKVDDDTPEDKEWIKEPHQM